MKGESMDPLRESLISEIEARIRPLIEKDKSHGGYDCCGCSTYDVIVDDCIRVIRGEKPVGYNPFLKVGK
jgi:hypothetical protein